MSDEIQTAKTIVCGYWEELRNLHPENNDIFMQGVRVRTSEPKELIKDFRAIIDILKKAVEQLEVKINDKFNHPSL